MPFKYKNILIIMLFFFISWILFTHVVQTSQYNLQCLNPVIQHGQFEDYPVPSKWKLIQTTVHQRHLDRYLTLDQHGKISNPNLDGFIYTPWLIIIVGQTKLTHHQKNYRLNVIIILTVYGPNIKGNKTLMQFLCLVNAMKNNSLLKVSLTSFTNFFFLSFYYFFLLACILLDLFNLFIGIIHAEKLGRLLRKQYMEKHKLIPEDCPVDAIGLECYEEQKNQKTTQYEYFGLCKKV